MTSQWGTSAAASAAVVTAEPATSALERPARRLRLGVWTPSSPAPALFPRRAERARRHAESAGFDLEFAPSYNGLYRTGAGAPEQLADELHTMAASGRVDAVMAASGGWTVSLLLPHLDWELLRRSQVTLIGYSDVSALLWAAHAERVPAVHGPMLVSEFGYPEGPFDLDVRSLRAALTGRSTVLQPPGHFTDDNPWWDRDDDRPPVMRPASLWRSLRPGRAVGPVLAGCLVGVAGLFETPWMPVTQGHVVMLEDSDMGPDRFLALLTQWRQAGRLNDLAGLVIGRRGRPQASASGSTDFDDALDQILVGTHYPVVVDVDFGHTEPQWSIRLGWTMTMETAPPALRLDPAKESR